MSAAARRRGAEFDWVEITRRIVERYEAAIGNGRGRKAPTPAVTRRLGAESDS